PYYENLYEAVEAGQWGSRCYSSKQFTSTVGKERMRLHASNPTVGYEVGVTNALTRKVLMTIGQKLDPPSLTRSRFMPDFKPGKVARVAGPVIVAEGMLGAQMYEVVRVGDEGLIGEIIKIDGENATVQVYEE